MASCIHQNGLRVEGLILGLNFPNGFSNAETEFAVTSIDSQLKVRVLRPLWTVFLQLCSFGGTLARHSCWQLTFRARAALQPERLLLAPEQFPGPSFLCMCR